MEHKVKARLITGYFIGMRIEGIQFKNNAAKVQATVSGVFT